MNELDALPGWSFAVHTSRGGDDRARTIADQAERMTGWLATMIEGFTIPDLYVVGPDDRDAVAAFPLYGMPHTAPDRIVVGQEPAPFWNVVLTTVEAHFTATDWAGMRRVYGDPPNLGPFADLLVSHEIGHYLHKDGEPTPTTFWLQELLANVAMHGYVHEVQPELKETLLTVVRTVWNASREWPLSRLRDMIQAPGLDGSNYVWFEFGLEILADRLWTKAGATGLRGLIRLLDRPAPTHDEAIDAITAIEPGVATNLRQWPHFFAL